MVRTINFMKKDNGNIHENLKDVTQEWKEKKHQRALQIKEEWMDIIKKDLKRRFQEKEVEVFKKNIKSGLKLSMAELSKLNAV